MKRFAQFVRVVTVLAAASTLVIASLAVGSGALSGQDGVDGCVEEWEGELGPCVELAYSHRGKCMGSACWTTWEMCCLPELVVIR